MSKFRTTEMGGRENLHFFHGFSIFCDSFEGCFSHCNMGEVCGCDE